MAEQSKVNKTDLKIINILQTNARITNQQLAEQVHLSASACLSRVKRLESSGVLKRYITEIDLEKLAPHVEAFTEVTLDNHFPEDYKRFEEALREVDDITEPYKISGAYDYLLKFVCTDVKGYNRIASQLLERNICIGKMNTLIILERTKSFSGYPLESLVDV